MSNSNSNDYDAFEDVIGDYNGVFGATEAGLDPGLKKHEDVQVKTTKHGVVFQLSCQGCGKPTQMTVEWPEMVALKYGVNPAIAFRGHSGMIQNPTRWEFRPDEQAWRPDMQCRHCQFHIPLRVSPAEPERFLAAGRRSSYINPQGEQQVAQIAAAAARQGQAVRR
jgi:hypothetical protein